MTSPIPTAADEEAQRFPYWRRNRAVFPFANILCAIGWNMAWPFVPLMVRDLGVRENLETWVGYMLLAFYLVSSVANPVWGGIADYYGRKLMVLRAMLGMGVTMMFVPFAPTPVWFALALMLFAAFNGFTPAGVSLIVANTPPNRIGSAVSIAQTGGQVGHAIGPVIGAAIAAYLDRQHALYWFSAGFMLAGGLLVLFYVREVKQVAPGQWQLRLVSGLRELVKVPRIAPLLLLAFLFSILWHGSVANISLFMLQLLDVTQPGTDAATEAKWVGAAATAMALSMMISLPVWGRVIDRIGPGQVLAFGAAACIVTHLPLLFLQTPLQLVLSRVAFGLLAAGMQTALFQLLRIHAPAGMDARAISYATAMQFLAMGVAPFCAGLIGPALGLRTYFGLTLVLMAGGLAYWLRQGRASQPS